MDLPHYNNFFQLTFEHIGYDVVYQPSCLQAPYDNGCWEIKFPTVEWSDKSLVIMHCQDWVTAVDGFCPELQVIEKHFGDHANQVVVIHWNINLHKIYNGPLRLMYFATHSYELIQKIRSVNNSWHPQQSNQKTKIWQCLNGIIKPHREKVARYLQNN